MSVRPVYVIATLIFVLAIGVLVYGSRQDRSETHRIQFSSVKGGSPSVDLTSEIAYWKTRIQKVGAEAAHNEFTVAVDETAKRPSVQGAGTQWQHVEAHTFGEALYSTAGLAGSGVCGQEYGAGCLHAFFGNAVQDLGITNGVAQLSAVCNAEEDPLEREFCAHGIGHGVLAAIGYELSDLAQALTVCERIESSEENFMMGCGGGAYMEYSIRFLLRADGTPPRLFTTQAAYQPCDELPATHLASCMFWQPTWWLTDMRADIETSAREYGILCEGLKPYSEDAVRACFSGIGYVVPQKTRDPETTARSCAISANPDHRAACWKYALSRSPVYGQLKDKASVVCDGLAGASRRSCISTIADLMSTPRSELIMSE